MRVLVAVAAAALVAGCAAGGIRVNESQLAAFKPGEATRDQVIAALGAPTMQTRLADGTSLVIYSYYEARVRPATFIPIVGAFAGGSDSTSTTATLRFDAAGKLLDTSTSSSAYGTGTGLSAGQVSPPTQGQPRR